MATKTYDSARLPIWHHPRNPPVDMGVARSDPISTMKEIQVEMELIAPYPCASRAVCANCLMIVSI